jgi:hypothetical protein
MADDTDLVQELSMNLAFRAGLNLKNMIDGVDESNPSRQAVKYLGGRQIRDLFKDVIRENIQEYRHEIESFDTIEEVEDYLSPPRIMMECFDRMMDEYTQQRGDE